MTNNLLGSHSTTELNLQHSHLASKPGVNDSRDLSDYSQKISSIQQKYGAGMRRGPSVEPETAQALSRSTSQEQFNTGNASFTAASVNKLISQKWNMTKKSREKDGLKMDMSADNIKNIEPISHTPINTSNLGGLNSANLDTEVLGHQTSHEKIANSTFSNGITGKYSMLSPGRAGKAKDPPSIESLRKRITDLKMGQKHK